MDGYVRVSRRLGRSGPGYISPTVQRDAVQRWADYRGVEILQWHVDEDESGGTQSRPGLVEAMRRIEAGETDGLACWRLNRFARNVSDAIRDIKRIQAAGAHLALVEEGIDPSGQFGMFLLTILLAVATLERDNAVAGFAEAKRRAVERGAYISRTPFGYERRPDGTLAPHPRDAPIVSEAFRLAAGGSLTAALAHMRASVPQRRWTTGTVRRMLAGRSYLGETRNGPHVKLDTHEPIVSRAIWEAAQSTPAGRQASADFPLSGFARCGTCGLAMVGGRGGKGQRTYRCSGTISTHRGEKCPRGAVITASLLEDHVRDIARTLLRGMRATVSDPEADTLALLERAIAEAEAELDSFAGDLHMRRALGDRYHAHLDSRVEAVEKARKAYREQARSAQSRLALSGPDVVDDPELFPIALRGMLGSVVVAPGRGMSVGERVRLVPLDADGTAGIAEPQGSE